MDLPRLRALRYVQPLREGGSLPAVVDTERGLFVAKFRGAGQGARVLVAELVAGLLARALGLPVPELALVEVVPLFGRTEPDPEIQDILRGSHGVNVGMRYLDGAFNFDPAAAGELVDPALAAGIVWFDAFLTNPDRTARNPNLLVWRRRPWMIDHGAALYAHFDWSRVDEARTRAPFGRIRDHVLLERAGSLEEADARLAGRVDGAVIDEVVGAVPEELLLDPLLAGEHPTVEAARDRYRAWLRTRLEPPRAFVEEALRAREIRAREPRRRREARR